VNAMRVKSRLMKINKNKYKKARRHERGVVLIAVMMFIAMILPVTLLILDSVRIESLLPINEAYTRTAGDEADKGFEEAITAIMADQDAWLVDPHADITDPAEDYFVDLDTRTMTRSTSLSVHSRITTTQILIFTRFLAAGSS
jgi:hypothetical protein